MRKSDMVLALPEPTLRKQFGTQLHPTAPQKAWTSDAVERLLDALKNPVEACGPYRIEFYAGTHFGGWNLSSDDPGGFATETDAAEFMHRLHTKYPTRGYRVIDSGVHPDGCVCKECFSV